MLFAFFHLPPGSLDPSPDLLDPASRRCSSEDRERGASPQLQRSSKGGTGNDDALLRRGSDGELWAAPQRARGTAALPDSTHARSRSVDRPSTARQSTGREWLISRVSSTSSLPNRRLGIGNNNRAELPLAPPAPASLDTPSYSSVPPIPSVIPPGPVPVPGRVRAAILWLIWDQMSGGRSLKTPVTRRCTFNTSRSTS